MHQYLEEYHPESSMQWLLSSLIDTGLRITEACDLKREHVFLGDSDVAFDISRSGVRAGSIEAIAFMNGSGQVWEAIGR
jgi:integrase